MIDAGIGLALTAVVSGIVWVFWGQEEVIPAATFGMLATLIHVAAVALLKSGLKKPFSILMWRWVAGMGLRLLGVVLFALAVFGQGDRFPAIPTAIGYAGVLLPLMFAEMRFIR